MKIRIFSFLIMTITALVMYGCGGGGGGAVDTTTTVSGVVSKSQVSGATITIYAIRSGAVDRSAALGSFGPTLATGAYSINIGNYTGPILVEARGGTYLDEASGNTLDISGLANGLRAVKANAAGSVSVALTPLTEMAASDILAAPSIDEPTISRHNTEIANLFGVSDIIGVLPVNAAATPGSATQAQIAYGLALATISQYIQQTPGATLGSAVATLGADQPATQTLVDLVAARNAFIGSAQNKTGVTGNTAATAIVLKLSTTGTLATANSIGGIQVTINLPPGVSVANVAGDASAAVTATGVAADSTSGAGFADAILGQPATLKLLVVKTSGFGTGEFATVNLIKTAGSVVTPAHFILTGFKAASGVVDANGNLGNALSGLAPVFVASFQ